MTESGLSGEPGLRVLAVVEQQLRPGPGRVTTRLRVAMDSPVLGDLIRPWPAAMVRVRILVSGSDRLHFDCNENFEVLNT